MPIKRFLRLSNSPSATQLIAVRIFIDRTVRIDLAKHAPESRTVKSSTVSGESIITKNVIVDLRNDEVDSLVNVLAPGLLKLATRAAHDRSKPAKQDEPGGSNEINESVEDYARNEGVKEVIHEDGWKCVVLMRQESAASIRSRVLLRQWSFNENTEGEHNEDDDDDKDRDEKSGFAASYKSGFVKFECDVYVQKRPGMA